MSLGCYECGITLLSDSDNIYRASFALSLMKRAGDGRLLISNNGIVVCRTECRRSQQYLSNSSRKMEDKVFFALDNKDGFDGVAADPRFHQINYQFLTVNDGRKAFPKASEKLLNGLEIVTWLRFAELVKKQTAKT